MQFYFHKILLPLFLFGLIGHSSLAQVDGANVPLDTLSTVVKSTENLDEPKDSLIQNPDLLLESPDSIHSDSIQKKQGALEHIVRHQADSVKENFIKSLTTLYGNAEVNYGDLNIKAGYIEINHETNMVMATGIIDTTGYVQSPVVTQAGTEATHDSIRLNYKTEKAVAWGTISELSGMGTNTNIMKKVNDSMIYIRDVVITTSDKSPPDYHIVVDKGVMVPDRKIIGGKSQLYIAEVPTPVILPFAYFPLTKGRTSGIIMPSYGSTQAQGFYLQNGGYYLALNEYFDLALTGDLYTNGSWGMNAQSAYNVRYKYSGTFGLRYEKLYNSIRGFSDFGESSNYNIRWSHTQDAKGNPNGRFSTSVNLGSSTYYRQSLNEYNSNSFLNNTLSSSISYQKRFVGTPFNMTTSMTHTQNTNTQSIDMSFPSLQLSMDRLYPFAPKNGSKKGMLQNIGTTYNLKGDYKVRTTDEFFFKKEMFESAQTGIQHDANLSTNTKILKYFTLSPNARYKEVWYFESIDKEYVPEMEEVVTDTVSGFASFREYNAGASLSTTLYGDFQFKKGKIEAIRHTMRPSVSYGYKPDFSNYYEEYQNSADPEDIKEYNPFQGGIYGSPSKGISNSMGFTIANTLEAKVKSKDSTDLKPKKVSLIKNLNFSSNYNMAADSLKWSPVNTNMGVAFFNNKMAVNIRAVLDPYAIDVNGRKIDKFNIDNGGSLFRLTSAGLTTNYSFSSKNTKKDKKDAPKKDDTNSDGIFGEDLQATNQPRNESQAENTEKKTTKVFYSTIPWSLKVAYAVNYSNNAGQDEFSSHSVMFSGDLELTPKWEMGFSSGYDFKNKGFTYTQLRFNRDLDSWRMSFNWVPFGPRTTYNFFIGIKSGIMSDLKYDQQQKPDRRLF